jgi:hypothetical protein
MNDSIFVQTPTDQQKIDALIQNLNLVYDISLRLDAVDNLPAGAQLLNAMLKNLCSPYYIQYALKNAAHPIELHKDE